VPVPGDSEPVDWRKLREFAGVDLTGSFVLTWCLEADTLFIDSDVLLLPEHPYYEKPRPAEKVCIRPAIMEFPFCSGVSVVGVTGSNDTRACVSSLGHGAISGMQRHADGRYELQGEFGCVIIEAERPVLRLKGL
jgi:hypothetical protein